MKLIIDVDDNVFTRLFDNGVDTSAEDRRVIDRAVRDGRSYNPTGDAISRSDLKETIINPLNVNDAGKNEWYEGYYTAKNEDVTIIANAPPVEITEEQAINKLLETGWLIGHDKEMTTRPQGDLISREALRSALEVTQYNDIDDLTRTERLIDNAPTVEAFAKEDMAGAYNEGYACGSRESKRPQGEWINREAISNTIFPFWERYECNQCHKFNGYSNFCPNCGADMRGTEK